MNSGRLRHRITIQNETTTISDYGESTRAWSDYVSLWSDVRDVKQSEEVQADQVVAKSTHTIKIRHQAAINTTMRVKWESRYFQIDGIRTDRTDAKWQILDVTEID